jgi:hypothetical protein
MRTLLATPLITFQVFSNIFVMLFFGFEWGFDFSVKDTFVGHTQGVLVPHFFCSQCFK